MESTCFIIKVYFRELRVIYYFLYSVLELDYTHIRKYTEINAIVTITIKERRDELVKIQKQNILRL